MPWVHRCRVVVASQHLAAVASGKFITRFRLLQGHYIRGKINQKLVSGLVNTDHDAPDFIFRIVERIVNIRALFAKKGFKSFRCTWKCAFFISYVLFQQHYISHIEREILRTLPLDLRQRVIKMLYENTKLQKLQEFNSNRNIVEC